MRVSAHQLESAVITAIRGHFSQAENDRSKLTDRELIEQTVSRIVIGPQEVEIHLIGETTADGSTNVLRARWHEPVAANLKGIVSPSPSAAMNIGNRDLLLTAIAKARTWVANLAAGRVASFAEIARREGKVERHIRLLAPLAFVAPHIISKIVDGHAPAIGVIALAKQVSWSWAQQQSELLWR